MNSKLRFVTAASLFDGHDVSINIMRRLLQAKGVEVIHLGHNRSALEVADAAISEDVHAVAISSYQGGHNEYFKYVRELLDEAENERMHLMTFIEIAQPNALERFVILLALLLKNRRRCQT